MEAALGEVLAHVRAARPLSIARSSSAAIPFDPMYSRSCLHI